MRYTGTNNVTQWMMLLSRKRIAPATFLLLIICQFAVAQLKRIPIPGNGQTVVSKIEQNPAARTQTTLPLSLPFFDDFSKPILQRHADTLRWVDSYSVWINDGMAIRPPTIYVATFDGLDSSGRAYNANDILLTGYADNLTSQPIDLSEVAVPVAERAGVYLSFFYQWQGNLEAPDEKDFLEVGFKTADENGWQTVMTIFPKSEADATVFYDTIIQVNGDAFFHDRFQFRFRSYGRLSGPYDTWHVDYVYLNKGRNIEDLSFPDRAISTQLGPLFGKYRAMPRNHFFSNTQLTPPGFEVRNMKNVEAPVNFRTDGYFSSTDLDTDNTVTYETVISKATPINISDNVLFAYEHRAVRMDTLPDVSNPLQFPTDPGIDSTLIRLRVALQTRDDIPFDYVPPIDADSTGDYTRNYLPIKFTVNDTVTADYVLSSYYAYDDGVAEYAAGLIEAGNLVAYEFEIDTSYSLKQDTLIAFDIYFPPYAVTSNQTVDFFIYHEDNGMPGELWLRIPARRVLRKGVHEFQRIQFLPALLIDEKKFFIGWQEPLAGEVVVGLDIGNDTGDKIFVNTNGFWYQNEDVAGSLMLRPVFGSGIIDARVSVENPREKPSVYPNPSKGTFYIQGAADKLEIFSLNGERIPFLSTVYEERTEIKVETAVPGLYILRYRQGLMIRSLKLVIAP